MTASYYFRDEDGLTREAQRRPGDDRIRGECSGIPPCCIAFFVNVWPGICAANDAEDPVAEALYQRHLDQPARYIPCGDCIDAGRFVEVRSCAADGGAHCICGTWSSSRVIDAEVRR